MTQQEARQILGVTEETSWEEIVKVSISYNLCCGYMTLLCLKFKCISPQGEEVVFEEKVRRYTFLLENQ